MYNFVLRIAIYVRNETWKLLDAITLGVRVIAVKDNKVLLVRHTYKMNWHLPGGGVKRKETFVEAAIRELYEEARAKVKQLNLVDVYTNFAEGRNDHMILFSGNIVSLESVKTREVAEIGFFDSNHLPHDTDPQCRVRIQEFFRSRLSFAEEQ